MTGKYNISAIDTYNNIAFNITVIRKYTILRGDSGTGKTTFADMILNQQDYSVSCQIVIKNIQEYGTEWYSALYSNTGMIIVVDEDFSGYIDKRFLEDTLLNSDNYFILITRDSLYGIPYSYTEIYELESAVYGGYKNIYNKRIYSSVPVYTDPDLIVTEGICSDNCFFFSGCIQCTTMGGRDNASDWVDKYKGTGVVALVVDGAAFGCEMQNVLSSINDNKTAEFILFLPESFEYLLLKAGAIDVDPELLESTYDYCDDSYFLQKYGKVHKENKPIISWERFYAELLMDEAELVDIEIRKRTGKGAHTHSYKKGSKLRVYYLKFYDKVMLLLKQLG